MKNSFYLMFGTYQVPSEAIFLTDTPTPGMTEFKGTFGTDETSAEFGCIMDRYGQATISDLVFKPEKIISFTKKYPRPDQIRIQAHFIRDKGYYSGRWVQYMNGKQIAWGPIKIQVVPSTLDLFRHPDSVSEIMEMVATQEGGGELFPVGT